MTLGGQSLFVIIEGCSLSGEGLLSTGPTPSSLNMDYMLYMQVEGLLRPGEAGGWLQVGLCQP